MLSSHSEVGEAKDVAIVDNALAAAPGEAASSMEEAEPDPQQRQLVEGIVGMAQNSTNSFGGGSSVSEIEDICEEEDEQDWHRRQCEKYVQTTRDLQGRTHELFGELWEYFDGKHIFEEIMWKANVKRDQVMAVLTDPGYKDVLFMNLHP